MRTFSALIFGLIFVQATQSQSKDIDSFEIARLDTIILKANSYYETNLDSALYILDGIKNDVDATGDVHLKSRTILTRSKMLMRKKEYASIIELLQFNLNASHELSPLSMAKTYRDLGNSYRMQVIPDSAVINLTRALKLANEAMNTRTISLCYLDLGLVYYESGEKELGDDFFEKSMKYSENSEIMKSHKKFITDNENRPVPMDLTIEMAMDIVRIAKKENNINLLAVAYSDVRNHYFRIGEYDKSLEFADKELEVRSQLKFDATIPLTRYDIATIHARKQNWNTAIRFYQMAEERATDTLKLSIYQGMKEAYSALGNTSASLSSLEKYIEVKDSVAQLNIRTSIAELATKYQTELKEEQIKTLNAESELQSAQISRQRTTIFGTIGGGVLLLFLGFLGYKNYKSRQELNYTQLNFRLLQTQMNPHFMFNALNEIGAGASEGAKTRDNLASYSKLMRNILESSAREFVIIQSDIDLISNYLKLQQLVQSNTFEFDVMVDEELDTHYLEIPPMITQPYVENAVIHGVKDISAGKISVDYTIDGDHVLVLIQDNGKGFTSKNVHSGNELHQSMGTDIIQKRMNTYRRLYKFEINSTVTSKTDSGTEVRIRFPVKVKKV